MTDELKQAILDGLRQKIRETANQDQFDLMETVQRALRNWDGVGLPPYADELRQWGLLPAEMLAELPTQPEPVVMQAEPTPEPRPEPPAVEELPAGQPPAEPVDSAPVEPQVEPMPQVEETKAEVAAEAPAVEPPPVASPRRARKAAPPEEAPAVEPETRPSDPDAALREDLATAQQQMENARYYDARRRLEKLLPQARTPEFKQEISDQLGQVRVALQNQVDELVEEAQKTERQFADNLDLQEEAWKKVREANPDDVRSAQALDRLGKQRIWRAAEREMQDVERGIDTAKGNDDLKTMTALRARMETLVNQASRGELPEELGQKVQNLNRHFKHEHDAMRSRLGIAATRKVEGDLKGSYALARKYLAARTPVMVDVSNVMGQGAEAEVDTEDFFKYISREFVNSLKDLVGQRLSSAEAQAPGDPEGAKTLLGDTLSLIDNSGLTQDDLPKLDGERQRVQDALSAVERRLEKFRKASEFVGQARVARDPQRRVDLLSQARVEYAEYPNLEMLEQQAADNLADQYARVLDQNTADADSLAKQEVFEEAVKLLRDSRKTAADAFPQPKPGSKLEGAIQHSLEVEENVLAEQSDHQQMLAAVQEAGLLLAEFDQTKAKEKIASAWIRYNRLAQHPNERIRRHNELLDLHAKLTARQSSGDNFDAGEAAYSRGEWQQALQALGQVTSDFPRYAEAQAMGARARAARLVEEAKTHEPAKQYKAALEGYRAAVSLVDGDAEQRIPGVGADAFILNLIQAARQKVIELAPIEAVDTRIKALIETAQNSLKEIKKGAEARILPAAKVAPVAELPRLAEEIKAALKERSDYYTELIRLQNDVFAVWREIYLDGMRAALVGANEALVGEGRKLAEELKHYGLVDTDADQILDRKLECLELDLAVFAVMVLDPATGEPDAKQPLRNEDQVDFNALERNRERRLELLSQLAFLEWTPAQADRSGGERYLRWGEAIIRAQLRALSRERIKIHVQKLKREADAARGAVDRGLEGLRKAQRYLEEQLDNSPMLAADDVVVRDLVEYYWQTGLIHTQIQSEYQDANDSAKAQAAAETAVQEWGKAETAARRLNMAGIPEGKPLMEAWQGLGHLARAFAEERVEAGMAIVEGLKERFSPAVRSLVAEKVDVITDETLKRLISEANTAANMSSPVKLLQAARKYSLASQLDKNKHHSREIELGLQGLGNRVAPILENRCTEANNLRIGNRPLSQALTEANNLYQVLDDIEKVAVALDLDENLSATLDEALVALGGRKLRWQNYSENQKLYDASLAAALSTPIAVLQDDGGEKFEWSFADPREKLRALQEIVANDDELRVLYERLRTALEHYEDEDAAGMLRKVSAFMKAVQDEAFDLIDNPDPSKDLGKVVEDAWAALHKRDARWGGLSVLLEHDYSPFFNDSVSTIAQHKTCAALQQANYNDWKRWADTAESLYKDATQDRELLAKNLPELVQEISLEEVVTKCKQAISKGGEFINELGRRPNTQPLSKKALAQKARIPDSNRITVEDTDARARALVPQAEQQQNRLMWGQNAPLPRLRKQMEAFMKALQNNRGVDNARAAAEVALRACEELDRCNEEVIRARRKLRMGV